MARTRDQRTFYEVVAAAVKDLTEHGFDSEGRIEFWTQQLREAAERSARPAAQMEEMLRAGLGAMYRRLVDRGEVARYHPGVARFTLERVRPALRAELDRRILAASKLIKLNREEAIAKTLQRFRGWSTSLPPGPAKADKPEARKDLKKALASLPFVERRVLIDQGFKLRASISEVLARDGAALAGTWHSHYRQAGYDYREDHKERDGEVYLLRGTWALAEGLIKPGPAGYYDSVTSVGQEVYCRCWMTWLYHLRDLPPAMLTWKGTERLAAARDLLRKDAA